MKECTIDELIKSNRLCASGDCGSECYFYIYDEFCQDELKAHSAKYLESQQKEISDLKKQIAETYTAEQYRIDCQRMCESYPLCTGCPSLNECGDHHAWIVSSKTAREWALSHPEKPKVTNCDKLIEVFGDEASGIVASNSWLKAEYKEPSDK